MLLVTCGLFWNLALKWSEVEKTVSHSEVVANGMSTFKAIFAKSG